MNNHYYLNIIKILKVCFVLCYALTPFILDKCFVPILCKVEMWICFENNIMKYFLCIELLNRMVVDIRYVFMSRYYLLVVCDRKICLCIYLLGHGWKCNPVRVVCEV